VNYIAVEMLGAGRVRRRILRYSEMSGLLAM